MIIIVEPPFRFVEGERFQVFSKNLEPRFNIPSYHKVVKDVLKIYVLENDLLKNLLKGQRVCLTIDTWISVQNLNYICLIAHFVDNDWKLHKCFFKSRLISNNKGDTIGKMSPE